ncbi:hypothetical protein NDU88_005099 [Pleurodeles waltl]|uniref:Uncharacterized protein n=1 Tax=Pleurodeles waltl TaxID=8319 RepID=A0AAV7NMX9_PLEWA|nr:hypothetical protein NDU88_005099 [Pleurodeles waltl]
MLSSLKRGKMLPSILAGITGARELWNQLPSEILFQPRQSQKQACADSASAALETQPGRRPSVPADRPQGEKRSSKQRGTAWGRGEPRALGHPSEAGVCRGEVEEIDLPGIRGELQDEEQQSDLSWDGVVQDRQTTDLNRGMVGTVERWEESGDHSLEQLVPSTSRGSKEIEAAQDPRGEEKAEPRAAGQTNEGSEKTAKFKCSDVRMVQWNGRAGAPVGVLGHQQATDMVARSIIGVALQYLDRGALGGHKQEKIDLKELQG